MTVLLIFLIHAKNRLEAFSDGVIAIIINDHGAGV